MCRSRRELSNEYLLAKIGVDTAENEPLEVWGENSIHYSLHSLATYLPRGAGQHDRLPAHGRCSIASVACVLARANSGRESPQQRGESPPPPRTAACGAQKLRDRLASRLLSNPNLQNWENLHFFCKILQIFGGLVLGCIKTKFCKKICV